jgi:2'-5' RNA ligase
MIKSGVRRQLSLNVPEQAAVTLEAVRARLDPIQYRLIPSHVTLCREKEISALTGVDISSALRGASLGPITLAFGRAETFDEHGVRLPCIAGEDVFARLRERLLGPALVFKEAPHITLAHPRNERSGSHDFNAALDLPAEIEITFPIVSLIEQTNGEEWRVLGRYRL